MSPAREVTLGEIALELEQEVGRKLTAFEIRQIVSELGLSKEWDQFMEEQGEDGEE